MPAPTSAALKDRLAAAPPPLAPRAWLRWDVVSRVLDVLAPRTVIEVGCGQGAVGARLAARADYLAAEPDPTSWEVASARVAPHGGRVVHGLHTALPAGSTADLVCAFEVLEHLEDDRSALAQWVELVRPGGHLMLSVPAYADRFGPMDVRSGHFRRYDPDSLGPLLTGAGLVDPRVVVYGWPLGYALEAVRNRTDAKKVAATAEVTIEERTAASGRTNQPRRPLVGAALATATLPFRLAQRFRPDAGTGLVAFARRPDA